MDREQAVKYLQSSGFSEEQIRTIEGAFTCDKCVYSTSEGCQYDDITETIPPVTPQPKTGHWIMVHPLQEDDDGAYLCSECKMGEWENIGNWKFCPNCGARMVEPQESEVEE